MPNYLSIENAMAWSRQAGILCKKPLFPGDLASSQDVQRDSHMSVDYLLSYTFSSYENYEHNAKIIPIIYSYKYDVHIFMCYMI